MKVAVVALALVWGAVHHFVVRPRLEAGEDPDVHPSLVGEAIVAFSVLLAAAILTNVAPPPVDVPPSTTGPLHAVERLRGTRA
jgi:putative copper export protein